MTGGTAFITSPTKYQSSGETARQSTKLFFEGQRHSKQSPLKRWQNEHKILHHCSKDFWKGRMWILIKFLFPSLSVTISLTTCLSGKGVLACYHY